MISYFNSGYLIRYIVALVISIVIWIPSFLFPQVLIGQRSVLDLFNFNTEWLNHYAGIFIIAFFLFTIVTALAINQILREYDLVNLNNTSGLAVFMIIASTLPAFTSVNLFIVVNLFLIIFIQNLLKLSVIEDPVSVIFNASFYLGIASLFFPPLVYLVLLIWISIFINRHTELRSFLVSLVGITLPYLFVFAWFYWQDTALENWNHLILMLTNTEFLLNFDLLDVFEIILLSLLFLIGSVAFFVTLSKLSEKGNFVRKNIIIGIYFMLLMLIIVLVFLDSVTNLLLLGLPSTIIIAITVYLVTKSRLLNISFSLLLICMLFYHYYMVFDVKELVFK